MTNPKNSPVDLIYRRYMLAAVIAAQFLPAARKVGGRDNKGVVEFGVARFFEDPTLLKAIGKQDYGSGKQPKLFHIPQELDEKIDALRLANRVSKSHVVECAIRAAHDFFQSEGTVQRTRSAVLETFPDADLINELETRGYSVSPRD